MSDPILDTDRLARITWSLIAEPSDAVALVARSRLGPVEALRVAREGDASDLVRRLHGDVPSEATAPSGSHAGGRAGRAMCRWNERKSAVDVEELLGGAQRRGIRVLITPAEESPEQLTDLQETARHRSGVHGPGWLDQLCGPRSVALVGSRSSTA